MNTKDDQKRQVLPTWAWLDRLAGAFDSVTRAPKQPRRIVQICASKHGVYALASDGEVWTLRADPNPFVDEAKAYSWTRLPNLPQE